MASARTSVKFYFITKERIANLLNWESQMNEDGSITAYHHYRSLRKVTLSDYLIPSNIVSTPGMSAYVGKIGTKAELWGSDDREIKEVMSEVTPLLKQYEI